MVADKKWNKSLKSLRLSMIFCKSRIIREIVRLLMATAAYIASIWTTLIAIGAAIDDSFISNSQSKQYQTPVTKTKKSMTRQSVRKNAAPILRQNSLPLVLRNFSRLYTVIIHESRRNSFKTITISLLSITCFCSEIHSKVCMEMRQYSRIDFGKWANWFE